MNMKEYHRVYFKGYAAGRRTHTAADENVRRVRSLASYTALASALFLAATGYLYYVYSK